MIAARIVIERRFREAQTTDARKKELEAAPKGQRQRAARAYRLAVEDERDAAAAANIQLFSDWLVTRSVIRSTLAAYYPDRALAAEWEKYANHTTHYIRLGSSASTPQVKRAYIELLARFLGESPDTWLALANDPRQLSVDGYMAYVKANALLSDRILREKNDLVRSAMNSDIAGFSTDTRDLLKDLTPFYG